VRLQLALIGIVEHTRNQFALQKPSIDSDPVNNGSRGPRIRRLVSPLFRYYSP
jgi:hypothetical protein